MNISEQNDVYWRVNSRLHSAGITNPKIRTRDTGGREREVTSIAFGEEVLEHRDGNGIASFRRYRVFVEGQNDVRVRDFKEGTVTDMELDEFSEFVQDMQ